MIGQNFWQVYFDDVFQQLSHYYLFGQFQTVHRNMSGL